MHKKTATIGYGVAKQEKIDENTLLDYVTVDDFQTYGMIPELLGRLPIITNLKPLDKETLVHILTKPKNSIVKQYQKLLAIDGVSLKFTKEALDYIANKAMEKKLGARGLRSIVENIMLEPMYNLPSTEKKELKITLDFAKRQLIKANMETKTETKKKIA
jgi:ATP-dependent Clp protease ATP-binding subunit ClpX